MAYSITQKLDGKCVARFQIQDGTEEKICENQHAAERWLIDAALAWNSVNITRDSISIYEEVAPSVRTVKEASTSSKATLEQRIADLEAKLARSCCCGA